MTTSTLTNFREVGGAGFQSGHRRTVYRSNTEPVGADAYPVPLDAVVDLRRDDEAATVPHPLAAEPGYRSVPLFDPSQQLEAAVDAQQLEDQYIDWIVRHRATIAAVFRTLAEVDGDVLVCCAAGKDRTGVVSALLARLWGADLERIGADYAATGPALTERFARERAEAEHDGRLEWTLRMQRCVPETAVVVVEHVEERYGSVRGYLRWIGLSDREVDRL
jgi:protein-tyrosine phosphatase